MNADKTAEIKLTSQTNNSQYSVLYTVAILFFMGNTALAVLLR